MSSDKGSPPSPRATYFRVLAIAGVSALVGGGLCGASALFYKPANIEDFGLIGLIGYGFFVASVLLLLAGTLRWLFDTVRKYLLRR